MRTGTKKLKTAAMGAFLVFMFFSVGIAYGLGGGGHHGDGRRDFPQSTAPANSNSSSSDAQQAPAVPANTNTPANGNSGSSGVQQGWAGGYSGSAIGVSIIGYHWTMQSGNDVLEGGYLTFDQEPVMVPEPVGALLLGLGMIGLAGTRKKFKK